MLPLWLFERAWNPCYSADVIFHLGLKQACARGTYINFPCTAHMLQTAYFGSRDMLSHSRALYRLYLAIHFLRTMTQRKCSAEYGHVWGRMTCRRSGESEGWHSRESTATCHVGSFVSPGAVTWRRSQRKEEEILASALTFSFAKGHTH